jgi:hypothetical protein
MKKSLIYSLLATLLLTAPTAMHASPATSDENQGGFWSGVTNFLGRLASKELTQSNCEIYHSDGYLFVNYWKQSSLPYNRYLVSCIRDNGSYISFEEYNAPKTTSPFGILPLAETDRVFVQADGLFSSRLMLDRNGTVRPISAVYSDGDNVYVDVEESFGLSNSERFLYLNTDMVTINRGLFCITLYHGGKEFSFYPPCLCFDNDMMYVSVRDNGLYFDRFGTLSTARSKPFIIPDNLCQTAIDEEVCVYKHRLAIYQHGRYSLPQTVYCSDGVFLFD